MSSPLTAISASRNVNLTYNGPTSSVGAKAERWEGFALELADGVQQGASMFDCGAKAERNGDGRYVAVIHSGPWYEQDDAEQETLRNIASHREKLRRARLFRADLRVRLRERADRKKQTVRGVLEAATGPYTIHPEEPYHFHARHFSSKDDLPLAPSEKPLNERDEREKLLRMFYRAGEVDEIKRKQFGKVYLAKRKQFAEEERKHVVEKRNLEAGSYQRDSLDLDAPRGRSRYRNDSIVVERSQRGDRRSSDAKAQPDFTSISEVVSGKKYQPECYGGRTGDGSSNGTKTPELGQSR
ncbi:hypothetical protein HK104_008865 [Borealophlyctis nickersoniae]|nr:hypothetical protein HK104_008865 [Borealophlyctis nickersoniae]